MSLAGVMVWSDKAERRECRKEFSKDELQYTSDCQEITFRLVCRKGKVMAKGYDGQYYDERDERLDDDW